MAVIYEFRGLSAADISHQVHKLHVMEGSCT